MTMRISSLQCILVVVTSLFVVLPALAKSSEQLLRTLTTARAAHDLTTTEAARSYPVRLTAVVTYYDRSIDPRRPTLFVSDSSGGIFVELSKAPDFTLKAGDLVSLSGVSGTGDYAPIVQQATAKPIGVSHLPAKAQRVDVMTLLTGAQDGQWVEIEGVVHAIRSSSSGANVFLDLVLNDGMLVAQTLREPNVDYSQFIDETILLRGNASPLFNHWGQMTGSQLVFPNVSSIKVEQNVAVGPFSLPLERIGTLLRYTPSRGISHRVHIQGRVTLYWPGRMLCIHDEGQGLCAETNETDTVHVGDRVDVIGFPLIGEFGPSLSHAYYRRMEGEQLTSPLLLTSAEILRTAPEAELVSIEGRFIGMNKAADDPTIVLETDTLTFAAVFQKKISTDLFQRIQNGSVLRLTGICLLRSDGTGRPTGSGFPIVSSFQILLRSPDDIRIMRKPSWWNATHTLRVLAVALLLMVGTLVRMVLLGKRIRKQTRTIIESEQRFKLLATLDSLTQLPNRHAILAIISSAIELTHNQNACVCIAIVDLDHFKKINDTYGHLAGDEVLRQAAARLSSSIEKTDSIGRYGGEEFLIVFHETIESIGVQRCEAIRDAICSRPITFGFNSLSLSCSIGLVSTEQQSIGNATTLIGLADDALYKAKANGRNRVEPFRANAD